MEDSYTGSGHIHLLLAVLEMVLRDGRNMSLCRTSAPNTLPASKSSFTPLFHPLCVQRGGNLLFVDSCAVPPYWSHWSHFKDTRQEGFEFCIVVGLKGQQHDAF